MDILITSPLYPPDIAPPAPYVKELAKRLAGMHTVTIVTYGAIPEEIANVTIVPISKRARALLRMGRFWWASVVRARSARTVIAQNGISGEVPSALAALITRTPLILCLSDETALKYAREHTLHNLSLRFALWCATHFITFGTPQGREERGVPMNPPDARPTINPLHPYPTEAFAAFERSWEEHLNALTPLLT